ncbi:hypothetical protein [Nocardioides sp.]|uniref:hypothetical protein n=1 Tax=Nocardioides sp. TaxID=35761 RepID=UPI003511F4BC
MSDPHEPPAGEPGEPVGEVGSVGEEAAKLFGALSDWARDQSTDWGAAAAGIAGQAAHLAREVDDHLATGAAECTYCPICRTVHLVRQTTPEVKAHLGQAASSLLQAVAGMLATVPPTGSGSGSSSVEHIDLGGDEDDDEEWT